MTARVPRAVLVNGVSYAVRRVPAERIDDTCETMGTCDHAATLILIASEVSTAAQRSTYLHEVGHAAYYESGAHEIVGGLAKSDKAAARIEEMLVQVWLPVYRNALGVR